MKILLFLVLSILSTALYGKIDVYYYNDYPPYSYAEGKEMRGVYYSIIKTALDEAKIEHVERILPFKRALAKAEAGDGLVAAIFKTEARAQRLSFSQGVYKEEVVLFQNKDKPFSYKGISSLADKRLGCRLGFSYGDIFDNARKRGKLSCKNSDDRSNLKVLSLGRIDAVVIGKLVGFVLSKEMGLTNLVPVEPAIESSHVYLAAKKGRHEAVLKRFNEGFIAIQSNGKYKKILDKYIPSGT